MTHKKTHVEEYQVEYCDDCGHRESYHYAEPQEVYDLADGSYMYTAEGCMVMVKGGRKLPGNNPYTRCKCRRLV